MGCVRSPQADSDLDAIWLYIATQSGNADVADRLVDSIVQRFLLLANYPRSAAAVTTTCARAFAVSLLGNSYPLPDSGRVRPNSSRNPWPPRPGSSLE